MTLSMRPGLGFAWIPFIIATAASAGSSVASAAISKPGQPKPLTEYEMAQLRAEEEKEQRKQFILLAAGGVLVVFALVMAMR